MSKPAARRTRRTAAVLASGAALALLAAVGCGDSDAPSTTAPAASARPAATPPAAATGADATREAQEIFSTRCVTCHGTKGAGDGPGSAGLTPKPRNLQDPAWQASVTDTHIEQIILYGGAAVSLSPAMPGNPDLGSKPAVVAELRKVIRALPEQ